MKQKRFCGARTRRGTRCQSRQSRLSAERGAVGCGLVRAKREAVARALADQQREEAGLVREQAKVETARLRFAEAARLYEEVAQLLPPEDRQQRAADWVSAGNTWLNHGVTAVTPLY